LGASAGGFRRHNLMISPTLSFNWLVRLLPIATAHTVPGCSHSGHHSPDARLHLQLRHYFMTEPMPGCMRQAMRIYVDGLEPLKRSGDRDKDLQDLMRNVATTVNRFANVMRTRCHYGPWKPRERRPCRAVPSLVGGVPVSAR
jgi:hypothetical protein